MTAATINARGGGKACSLLVEMAMNWIAQTQATGTEDHNPIPLGDWNTRGDYSLQHLNALTWTDVTSDLRLSERIVINRGASDGAADIEPGTMDLAFNNATGNYTPGLAGNAYAADEGSSVYRTIDRGIPIRCRVRYPVVGTGNWLQDPDFETYPTGSVAATLNQSTPYWFPVNAASTTLAIDTAHAHSGTRSLKWVTSATDKIQLPVVYDPQTMAPGTVMMFSAWVWITTATTLSIRVLTTGGVLLNTNGGPASTSTTGSWINLQQQATTTNTDDLVVQVQSTAAATMYVDDVSLTPGTVVPAFSNITARWYTRFMGRAMDFKQTWPTGRANYSLMKVSAAGGWRQKLSQPLGNALDTAFRAMPLVGYWPLDDPLGSLAFASGIPGKSSLPIPTNMFAGDDDGTGNTPTDSLPIGYGSSTRAYTSGSRLTANIPAPPTYGGDILAPQRSGAAVVLSYPTGGTGTGEKVLRFRFTDTPGGSVVADVLFTLAFDGTTAHSVQVLDVNGAVLNTLSIAQAGPGTQVCGVAWWLDVSANLNVIARIGKNYGKVTNSTVMAGFNSACPFPAAIYFQPSTSFINRLSHIAAWEGAYIGGNNETLPPFISQDGTTDVSDSHSTSFGLTAWKDDLLHLNAAINAHAESTVWQETLPQRLVRLGAVAGYPWPQINVDGSNNFLSWGVVAGSVGSDVLGSQPITAYSFDSARVRPAAQETQGSNPIDLLREAGRGFYQVYEQADGTLRCDDLRTRYNEAAWLSLPFTSLLPDFEATLDDQRIVNEVQADTPQGTARYVDLTSQRRNGAYAKTISSRASLDRDNVAGVDKVVDPLQIAAWQARPQADLRIPSVHWLAHSLAEADLLSFLTAEPIGALLVLTSPPSQLGVASVNLNVVGYQESIDPFLWDFQATVESRAPYDRVWTVEDATYGYGSLHGTTTTDSPLTAGATTMHIQLPVTNTNNQPPMTTTAGEFPQYWRLGSTGLYGGEVVQVTAVTLAGFSTATCTIVRGQLGTVARQHASGTTVENATRVVMGL